MSWAYQFEGEALRELRRLDHETQRRIVHFLDTKIAGTADPRRLGHSLRNELHGLWRWRVGDYRLIGRVQEAVVLVQIVRVGHRKNVYDT